MIDYPNAIIAGAQKCGTTWLARRLNQHTDIFVHRQEIHFFDNDTNYHKGEKWYFDHFKNSNKKIRMEKCGAYLFTIKNKLIPERIKSNLLHTKLIFILRNPIARAISAWYHLINFGHINPFGSINDILDPQKRELIKEHGVLERGLYYSQLISYFEYFSNKDILILFFEDDIAKNPNKGLQKVCKFLDVDPNFPFRQLQEPENKIKATMPGLELLYKSPRMAKKYISWLDKKLIVNLIPKQVYVPIKPNADVYAFLREYYSDDNQKLLNFLGYIPESWLS